MRIEKNILIKVEGLKKWFPVRSMFSLLRPELYVKAVNEVTFDIRKGEIFGLVGESGCGKTTIGRLILGLITPSDGKIYYGEVDVFLQKRKKELKKLRREMQMIYQDPYGSLNDRMNIYDIIAEPLRIHKITNDKKEEKRRVYKALEEVNLVPPEEFAPKFTKELSGGQVQRVAIARALILQPKFIVADEPVSMLDVSIRAGILNLLIDLKEKHDLTYLFITHDFSVARYVCNRIAVLYLGRIVEIGPVEEIIGNPLHPYAKALVSVVPVPNPRLKRDRILLKKEIPDPINIPLGCAFHPRCPYARELCRSEMLELVEVKENHHVACHLADKFT